MTLATDNQRSRQPFLNQVLSSDSVSEIVPGRTTQLNVVNYQRGTISHHTSQFDEQMGFYFCVKEAQKKTPQKGDFFISAQFVTDPFIELSFPSVKFSSGWELLCHSFRIYSKLLNNCAWIRVD